jgi:hypothetical protein
LQVIDPPFITREVWEKYATTARYLLAEGGRLICTTIRENAEMMNELLQVSAVEAVCDAGAFASADILQVKPQRFQPCIPHLVYQ